MLLIESGSEHTHAAQALGELAGVDPKRHAAMDVATRRGWGGTSALWGGRCVPLDPVDFEARPQRGNARWPFGYEQLAGFYERATDFSRCGKARFTVDEALGPNRPPIAEGFKDGEVLASTLERWSLPTRFGDEYRDEIAGSVHIRVVQGLTCVELDTDDGGQAVGAAVLKSLDGRIFRAQARQFVIAAGGLESTRLLFNSNRVHRAGLGNHADQLGRYYMGHASGKLAKIEFTGKASRTIFGFERDADGIYCRRRFTISAEQQRSAGLMNGSFWLDNPAIADARHRNGILSLAYLALTMPILSRYLAPEGVRAAAVAGLASSRFAHLWNVVTSLPATIAFAVPFVWQRYMAKRKVPGFFLSSKSNAYALHYHCEQAPNPDSRVTVSEQRDALGMRKIKVDLRFADADFRSIIGLHEILDAELRRQGVGRLHYLEGSLEAHADRQASDGFHQIGTTRMSERPEDGVVDGDCRVHFTDNLYVASSSVFPTSGQANPTLTIIALSLRLADHLSARLSDRGTEPVVTPTVLPDETTVAGLAA